jgi:trehalose-6-phosphatase
MFYMPSQNCALFLDVDGTLLDIAPTPATVRVPADLTRSLDAVAVSLGGALALVSGRLIDDLDRLFRPLRLPAAGLHGAEIRRSARGDINISTARRLRRRCARRSTELSKLIAVYAWKTRAMRSPCIIGHGPRPGRFWGRRCGASSPIAATVFRCCRVRW